jgi:hypothetical protein
VLQDKLAEAAGAGPELGVAQLVGAGRGTRDQVGAAQAPFQQQGVLEGRKEAFGQLCLKESAPEPVAGTGEVVSDGRRIEARVDAGEEDEKPGRDHVAQGPATRFLQLPNRRSPGDVAAFEAMGLHASKVSVPSKAS